MKWLFVCLLAAGCHGASNPCDGQSGICLAVEVHGNVPKLDVLDLTVTILPGRTLTAQATILPQQISLPVQFAALLPSDVGVASLEIEVVGIAGGLPIASGITAANVPPSGQRVRVELSTNQVDLSRVNSGDLSSSSDLAAPPGSDLSSVRDLAGADMAGCVATSCVQLGLTCGTPSDGCGRALNCGPACQLGAFSDGGTLTPGLTGFGIAQTNKFVYVMGGQDATAAIVARIQSAPLNADGTLGAFTTSTGTLTAPRAAFWANVIGSFIYVTGGLASPPVDLTTVDRAPINADGTIGAFVNAGVGLTTPRDFHVGIPVKNFFYVLGGRNFSTNIATASVERAAINADGTLGAFSPAGSLTVPRSAPTVLLTNGFLYVIGGGTDGGTTDFTSIERASVGADGTLGAFADAGITLASARFHGTTTAVGNDVYEIGGGAAADGGGTYLGTVEHATLTGSALSSFSLLPGIQLAIGREDHGTVFTGNSLYVIAGFNGTDLTSIERALLQ